MVELIALGAGLTIVGCLVLQLPMLVYTNLQRSRSAVIQRQLQLREWQKRVEAAELRVEEAESSKASWTGWRKFEVRKKILENEKGDICSFYFYPHDRKPLPAFYPGQFLMFRLDVPDLADPDEIVEESRCYSLSDSPNPRYYRISVKRVLPPPNAAPGTPPGVVSGFLHDRVQEGELIDVHAPSGDFFLDLNKESPVVLLAAGVGVTPILCMMNALIDKNSTREIWVFYGVRAEDELIMQRNFEFAAANLPNARVHFCFSDVLPANRSEGAKAANGIHYLQSRVDAALMKQTLPHNNYDYFICGPGPMMTGMERGLLEWGVPKQNVHWESFGGAPAAAPAPAIAGVAHKVVYAHSGKELTWHGEASLRTLAKANKYKEKKIKYACGQGKCGSCHTALKSGTVCYPGTQPAFPGLQAGYCLPCIAVPETSIELDA
ncbi:MAG: 2Fe-2S iron-sulfur cluster binding domain-containing protein [Candidatus Hydrogenedentes bacterium]|nr:2Fe-2S iron-sulfur cluster binding domain-containing protein [Candidatus Hydrogenedentota bacterium]